MTYLVKPSDGEVLKLGSPVSGEIRIAMVPRPATLPEATVRPEGRAAPLRGAVAERGMDPHQRAGSPCAMGTYTLPARGSSTWHRYLHWGVVLVVHKGQGRATVEGETMTVVPGVTIVVPAGAWHELKNTGTGMLQMAWIALAPGIERFFRELASVGAAADATAIEAVTARHGVECRAKHERPAQPEGSASRPQHRRRRRGGRGHRADGRQPTPAIRASGAGVGDRGVRTPQRPPLPADSSASRDTAGATTIEVVSECWTRGHPASPPRVAGPPARSEATPLVLEPEARVTPPTGRGGHPTPAAPSTSRTASQRQPSRRDRGRHGGGRGKEVYMGGRWVRVGEGPVIALGGEGSSHALLQLP